MRIRDWLFARKQRNEAVKEFDQMMKEYDSSPLPEGQLTGEGGVRCPHCGHELSLKDCLGRRSLGAVGKIECPRCRKHFKSH